MFDFFKCGEHHSFDTPTNRSKIYGIANHKQHIDG
jgi:hypothetical protein